MPAHDADGGHDRLVPLENARKPLREPAPLVGVAGVQVQLTATGLLNRELHLVTEALEQAHHCLAHGREQRVAQTGDKEAQAHEWEFPDPGPGQSAT